MALEFFKGFLKKDCTLLTPRSLFQVELHPPTPGAAESLMSAAYGISDSAYVKLLYLGHADSASFLQ